MVIGFNCLIVFRNPVDPGQVRKVSGSGSPAWVDEESATFSECVVAPAAVGGTGDYEFAMPAGLSAGGGYPVTFYDPAASAFTGTRLSEGVIEPTTAELVAAVWSATERTVTGGTVTAAIRPFQVVGEQTKTVARDFTLLQAGTETVTWVITDATGQPLDLSGKTVRLTLFKVEPPTSDPTLVARYDSPTDVTIGGDRHNNVARAFSTTDTQTAQSLRYVLWNQTDGYPLARGAITVEKAMR